MTEILARFTHFENNSVSTHSRGYNSMAEPCAIALSSQAIIEGQGARKGGEYTKLVDKI